MAENEQLGLFDVGDNGIPYFPMAKTSYGNFLKNSRA